MMILVQAIIKKKEEYFLYIVIEQLVLTLLELLKFQ